MGDSESPEGLQKRMSAFGSSDGSRKSRFRLARKDSSLPRRQEGRSGRERRSQSGSLPSSSRSRSVSPKSNRAHYANARSNSHVHSTRRQQSEDQQRRRRLSLRNSRRGFSPKGAVSAEVGSPEPRSGSDRGWKPSVAADRGRHAFESRGPPAPLEPNLRSKVKSECKEETSRNESNPEPHAKPRPVDKAREGLWIPPHKRMLLKTKGPNVDDCSDDNQTDSVLDGSNSANESPVAVAPPPREEPNFETTGLLAAETNSRNGVVLKFNLPPESRLPTKRWRLYEFKGDVQSKILHIHRQPAFLVGKDPRVADVLLLHPTISKQHAVIQFRQLKGAVLPSIMDLGSTNGTFLNGERVDPQRYYELREKDFLKFGNSSREFLLLHVDSTDDV